MTQQRYQSWLFDWFLVMKVNSGG